MLVPIRVRSIVLNEWLYPKAGRLADGPFSTDIGVIVTGAMEQEDVFRGVS